jgi:hypothetical protein
MKMRYKNRWVLGENRWCSTWHSYRQEFTRKITGQVGGGMQFLHPNRGATSGVTTLSEARREEVLGGG